MSIQDVVVSFLSDHAIGPCRLVIAVSGGFDSTALLLVGSQLPGFEIIAAHVNHHLRGDESDGDEDYVRALCERLGVTLIVKDGTLDPERVRARGIEAAAREVRLAKLQEIRERVDAAYIATAHQKNDQAETIMMRIRQHWGVEGLRGIQPIRDDGIIRPLLRVTRDEIERYLRKRGETPRVDRMNADSRFLRVRARRFLGESSPAVVEKLARIAERAQEWWPAMEQTIDDVEDVEATEDETRFRTLPRDRWLRRALLKRHIHRLDPEARDVSRGDLLRIEEQLGTLRRVTVTKNLELVGSPLRLRKIPHPTPQFEYQLRPGERVDLKEIGATFILGSPGQQPFMLPPGADATFTIRNRRNGDRFHPLGAPGSKKLKDFLIDRRIPIERRDRLALLVWNGEIVWVAGIEVSERFKVRDGGGDLYVATVHYGAK